MFKEKKERNTSFRLPFAPRGEAVSDELDSEFFFYFFIEILRNVLEWRCKMKERNSQVTFNATTTKSIIPFKPTEQLSN